MEIRSRHVNWWLSFDICRLIFVFCRLSRDIWWLLFDICQWLLPLVACKCYFVIWHLSFDSYILLFVTCGVVSPGGLCPGFMQERHLYLIFGSCLLLLVTCYLTFDIQPFLAKLGGSHWLYRMRGGGLYMRPSREGWGQSPPLGGGPTATKLGN